MESPPKRITRARAAAKAGEATTKQPIKVVTAATKARTAGMATVGTQSTAAKRKTRADENENEDSSQQQTTATRALRARPRRAVKAQEEAPAPAPAKTTRARGGPARKRADQAPGREGAEQAEAPEPARPRGRPRKTPAPEAKEPAPEPAKKATRGRPAAATNANNAAAAKPAATKKMVKFQDLDKENVEVKPKEPVKTGLRGRPARRGGVATTAARSSARAATPTTTGNDGQKKPLSPKKVTQMPVTRDDDSSEDELAAEKNKTPVKAMMMSPIKPPAGIMASARKREPAQAESASIAVEKTPSQEAATGASSLLGLPPRRLPSSPVKDSLKSPAKRMGPAAVQGPAVKMWAHHAEHQDQAPGLKTPLIQSVAKRPQSPIKGLTLPPTAASSKPLHSQSAMKNSMFQSPAKRAMPGWRPLTEPRPRGASCLAESPEMQPMIMATPSRPAKGRPSQKLMAEEDATENVDYDDLYNDSTENPPFSGRLSSVLPRHVDPALRGEAEAISEEDAELEEEGTRLTHKATEAESTVPANPTEEASLSPESSGGEPVCPTEDDDVDPMALDEIVDEMEESAELPLQADEFPTQGNPMYQLRDKDMNPCHDLQFESEDEDELPSRAENMAATTPARLTQTPRGRYCTEESRRLTIGLTSLAEQFGSWSTVSPVKPVAGRGAEAAEMANATGEAVDEVQLAQEGPLGFENSPFKGSFFYDGMLADTDNAFEVEDPIQGGEDEELETPLDGIMITEEDFALAQEANDMSAMEPEQIDAVVSGPSFNDGLSEASQEYGDENEMPVEALAAQSQSAMPVTPARPDRQLRTFFTTTKVPLKAADESTPSPLKKRSWSASRASHKRPDSLSRSATVISYSPSKGKKKAETDEDLEAPCAPATPSKTDIWSTMGTPARTPRRDLSPGLLRGAVVFVDVHTTEGADASGIFVELLSQMGARCVKTWQWNPTSPADGEASSNKVGITHVVYKDGGKRTLEKVRWANGLVHCVGVSWVLE